LASFAGVFAGRADFLNGAMSSDPLIDNWSATRARIASAALRYGRPQDCVRLLAISKGQPAAALRRIAALGQHDFGENYLQEALAKMDALEDLRLTWHFTGQIQGNKTRPIAERFAWAHTVDRERIAVRLDEQRPPHLPPLNICVQVSLESEPGKGGVEPHALAALAARIRELPRLRLRGLMCIPPHRESFEEQLAFFRRLSAMRGELDAKGFELDTLSMGMTADLDAAIAAGATCVRIGTAIFGARTYSTPTIETGS
jgi:pyridoxal phosphate enzyme (YggS family)